MLNGGGGAGGGGGGGAGGGVCGSGLEREDCRVVWSGCCKRSIKEVRKSSFKEVSAQSFIP
jgi:hypothetical protein